MRYAVVGASQGTGLLITKLLASIERPVRAISRNPPSAGEFVEPFSADVTSPDSISEALDDDFTAVFFTVDKTGGIGGHALFGSAKAIREVTFQGCVNTIDAALKAPSRPRFILLSVIGHEKGSMIWSLLNFLKPGLRRNVTDRENYLVKSGLPYVVLRAPKLTNDEPGQTAITAIPTQLKLTGSMSLARADLARVLAAAVDYAPENTIWDVIEDEETPAPDWLLQQLKPSQNAHESSFDRKQVD